MLGFITNFFQVYHLLFHMNPIFSPSCFSSFLFILRFPLSPFSAPHFSCSFPQSSFWLPVIFRDEQSCNKLAVTFLHRGWLRVPEGIAGWYGSPFIFIFLTHLPIELTFVRLIYIPLPVCIRVSFSPHNYQVCCYLSSLWWPLWLGWDEILV